LTTATEALGAAIYADPLCLAFADNSLMLGTPANSAVATTGPGVLSQSALFWANCEMVESGGNAIVLAAVDTADSEVPSGARGYVNAVELSWTVAFTIP
jgi:hypothetical protein